MLKKKELPLGNQPQKWVTWNNSMAEWNRLCGLIFHSHFLQMNNSVEVYMKALMHTYQQLYQQIKYIDGLYTTIAESQHRKVWKPTTESEIIGQLTPGNCSSFSFNKTSQAHSPPPPLFYVLGKYPYHSCLTLFIHLLGYGYF